MNDPLIIAVFLFAILAAPLFAAGIVVGKWLFKEPPKPKPEAPQRHLTIVDDSPRKGSWRKNKPIKNKDRNNGAQK